MLDPFYSRPTQYAQDLMSEITATRKIQHSEYEKLFEYYALIRGNITEARKANLMEALLTQANHSAHGAAAPCKGDRGVEESSG